MTGGRRHRRSFGGRDIVLYKDLRVDCPTCGQAAGTTCRAKATHAERVQLAAHVAAMIEPDPAA
jgi:hypothetical protein